MAPSVSVMFVDGRAAPTLFAFLKDTRVEKMVSVAPVGGGLCVRRTQTGRDRRRSPSEDSRSPPHAHE